MGSSPTIVAFARLLVPTDNAIDTTLPLAGATVKHQPRARAFPVSHASGNANARTRAAALTAAADGARADSSPRWRRGRTTPARCCIEAHATRKRAQSGAS
jgi:hypothetical protein